MHCKVLHSKREFWPTFSCFEDVLSRPFWGPQTENKIDQLRPKARTTPILRNNRQENSSSCSKMQPVWHPRLFYLMDVPASVGICEWQPRKSKLCKITIQLSRKNDGARLDCALAVNGVANDYVTSFRLAFYTVDSSVELCPPYKLIFRSDDESWWWLTLHQGILLCGGISAGAHLLQREGLLMITIF